MFDAERPARAPESIGAVQRAIPRACFEVDPARGFITLARGLSFVFTGQMLLHLVDRAALSPGVEAMLLVPLWLFTGWSFTTLYALGHECGHGAFSRKRWVNCAVGHLCLSPLFTSYEGWRIGHNHHHAHTLKQDLGPDQSETGRHRSELSRFVHRVLANVGFGSPIMIGLGRWLPNASKRISDRARRRLAVSSLLTILTTGTITVLLFAYGGAWAVFLHYLAPMMVGGATGAFLTLLHHTPPAALYRDQPPGASFGEPIASTFEARFPRFLEWMWLDINVHLPHHVSPGIPWYNLRRASAAIRAAHPDCHPRYAFSLRHLLRISARPFLRGNAAQRSPVMDR